MNARAVFTHRVITGRNQITKGIDTGILDDHYGAFVMSDGDKRGAVAARVLVVSLQQTTDPFWARTDRVGHRGVFLRSTSLLPVDSACLLKIMRDGESVPLWARATVVHHIPGAGFGCNFTQVAPPMRTRLDRWLWEDSQVGPLPVNPALRSRA